MKTLILIIFTLIVSGFIFKSIASPNKRGSLYSSTAKRKQLKEINMDLKEASKKLMNEFISYSFEFNSVSSIIVHQSDLTDTTKPALVSIIVDSKVINEIQQILKSLPPKGEISKSMISKNITTVFGLKNEKPVSKFEIYDQKIKAPDSNFYMDSETSKKEKELLKIINHSFIK